MGVRCQSDGDADIDKQFRHRSKSISKAPKNQGSVGRVAVSSDRPMEDIKVQGVNVRALIDTGSQISLVHEDWAKKHLNLKKLEQEKCRLRVHSVNGANVPYSGVYVVDIDIYGIKVEDVPVLVMKYTGQEGEDASVVIGMNVLKECDHSEKLPSILKKVLQTPEKKQRRRKVIKVAGTTNVTSMSVCHVRVDGPRQEEENLVAFENADNLPSGLVVIPTVLDTRVGHRFVRVMNTTGHDILLKRRHPLALLEKVEEIQDPNGPYVKAKSDSIVVSGEVKTESETDLGEDKKYTLPKSNGTANQQRRMAAVLKRRSAAFMTSESDLGFTMNTQHRIRLKSDKPIAQPYRRIPPQQLEEVGKHLKDMVQKRIIVPSYSPYAAPIVVVRKKDGSIRLCIDYRRLNDETISDAFPLPRIEDSFDLLSGAKFFSTLDLGSGYYQIAMAPEDQEKTAFSCPYGSFHYLRMPQGLKSAPATFQRLMQVTLDEVIFKSVLVYLDDIMIYSKTFEEHLKQVDRVLELIIEAGLKLKPSKCTFLKDEIKYLGHTISAEGIRGNDEKIKAISEWPRPKNVENLRSFLGLASYFRKFVKDFSKIAGPLHDVVTKKLAQNKEKGKRKSCEINPDVDWGDREEAAFVLLKKKLTEAPMLAFADFEKPFILETDASFEGLGAILSQKQDNGKVKVVAYASRRLHPTERNELNYSSYKLEFLAMKWAITEKFRDYLEGNRFVVYTDNNPLTHYRKSQPKSALEQRWIAQLESFDFEVLYRPGKSNPADPLSRHPYDESKESECDIWISVSDKIALSMISAVEVEQTTSVHSDSPVQSTDKLFSDSQKSVLIDSDQLQDTEQQEDVDLSEERSKDLNQKFVHNGPEIRRLQEIDPVIGPFVKSFPKKPKGMLSPDSRTLQKQFKRLVMKDGILYRRVRLNPGTLVDQLVLPSELKSQTLYSAHEEMNHQGIERTTSILRNRFYWVGMFKDVQRHIKHCQPCRLNCLQPGHTSPGHLMANRPLEVLAVDFVKLDVAQGGIEYALVMTDVFTKFSQVVATKSQDATVVAQVLIEHWFRRYGVPERIHTDQGRQFESKLIESLCELYGIKKSRTTAYYPAGNGQCERFNKTLIRMLSLLPEREKKRWPSHLSAVTEAYNTTPHCTTGTSPYYLMFGREPKLPVDDLFGDLTYKVNPNSSVEDYVQRHRQKLLLAHLNAYHRAKERLETRTSHQIQKKPLLESLEQGDVVRRKFHCSGRRKMNNYWNNEKFTVNRVQGEVIQIISHKDGSVHHVNRSNLMKVGEEFDPNEFEMEDK